MAISYLKYPLTGGFINNWLVAGPLAIPVSDLSSFPRDNFTSRVLEKYTEVESGVAFPPIDQGPVGRYPDPARVNLANEQDRLLAWRYYRCREDHFVDFSVFYPTCHYLRSWAYAQVICQAAPQQVEIVLTTNSSADLWLDGQHLYRQQKFTGQLPQSVAIPATLSAERSELLLRFETVARRETPYVLAFQIKGLEEDQARIVLPTPVELQQIDHRLAIEKIIESAYLDRYVYGYLTGDRYNRNEPVTIHFSQDLDLKGQISNRMQNLEGWIFQDAAVAAEPGGFQEHAKLFPLRNGPHHLAMLPLPEEYYIKKMQFERKDLFYVVRTPYAQVPYGTQEERQQEALQDAAERRNDSLYCEIAKIALKQGPRIDRQIVARAVERVQRREAGSVTDLLGLQVLRRRFWRRKHNLQDLKSAIAASILNYRYWEDQPGGDSLDFSSESDQIQYHTCEILAGQLFAEGTFSASGQLGRWHKQHGEQLALAWLQQRGQYGFDDWDSPEGFETILAALAQLVDLAVAPLAELASVIMDKIFFILATNSFQGAFGTTHGRSNTASVLSPRLGATSGISRLMWGLGNFNENIIGTVSLACCQNYELPEVLRQIAVDQPAAFWSRESHGASRRVNTVTYKTADFMLSSAQDYQPGASGSQEHIWQATLGPDAVIFVNHPVCLSESDDHQPNLWVGNGSLPRVAQWGDVLVAFYQLPGDDWLGFTHAYFPSTTFDEYALRDNWAFARKGKGYLALTAARGLQWITAGPTALRELRSYGVENIWLCHMGQELLDGSFESFQQKILAMKVDFKPRAVEFSSLRGDNITFGWEGQLRVNGQEQPLSNFSHIENPYCMAVFPCTQMDVIYNDQGLRLKYDSL